MSKHDNVVLTINFDDMEIHMDCTSVKGTAVRVVLTAPQAFILANQISDKATELSEYQAFRSHP